MMALGAPTEVVLAALALDLALGDPRWLPHPVRGIGVFIRYGERVLWTGRRLLDRGRGMFLAVTTVIGAVAITVILLRFAASFGVVAGTGAAIFLAWTTLALRGLADAAEEVAAALDAGDVERARQSMRALVGRDPDKLDEHGIARGAIESVAENASDGVVAPLFYLVAAGPAGAMAYKAVNTLDSMIGHRTARHLHFGRFAARLDDVANWIPARLTALGLVVAAALLRGSPRGAVRAAWRDARKHPSPNAGWPEAAMAGALGLQVGGPVHFGGKLARRPWLGDGKRIATAVDVRAAVRLLNVATAVAVALLLLARALVVGAFS